MKVLITGVAGFVGSHILEYLTSFDHECSGVDNFSRGYRERLKDLRIANLYDCSLRAFTKSNLNLYFDLIIHCSAIAPLPDNEEDPVLSYETNVTDTIAIAEYATKIGCRNLIFLSSGAVYENDLVFPSTEDTILNTSLVYPTTKLLAESALASYSKSYSLNSISLRLFNMYGPRQDFFRKQPPLIGYLLKSLICNETAYLYSDGEQSRDYIYIDDLCRLILIASEAMNSASMPIVDVINAGSGNSHSVNNIITLLEDISGKRLQYQRLPADSFWDKYGSLFNKKMPLQRDLVQKEVLKFSLASPQKALLKYQFKTEISLKEGLEKCYAYAYNYFKI